MAGATRRVTPPEDAPRGLASRAIRLVLRGLGGAWLVATGRGLPRPGEDRLWRDVHPDDDR